MERKPGNPPICAVEGVVEGPILKENAIAQHAVSADQLKLESIIGLIKSSIELE